MIQLAKIRVEKPDQEEQVKLTLTRKEAMLALTTIEIVRESLAEDIAKPRRYVKRMLRKQTMTEEEMKDYYRIAKSFQEKIGDALIALDADVINTAIEKTKERKKE